MPPVGALLSLLSCSGPWQRSGAEHTAQRIGVSPGGRGRCQLRTRLQSGNPWVGFCSAIEQELCPFLATMVSSMFNSSLAQSRCPVNVSDMNERPVVSLPSMSSGIMKTGLAQRRQRICCSFP